MRAVRQSRSEFHQIPIENNRIIYGILHTVVRRTVSPVPPDPSIPRAPLLVRRYHSEAALPGTATGREVSTASTTRQATIGSVVSAFDRPPRDDDGVFGPLIVDGTVASSPLATAMLNGPHTVPVNGTPAARRSRGPRCDPPPWPRRGTRVSSHRRTVWGGFRSSVSRRRALFCPNCINVGTTTRVGQISITQYKSVHQSLACIHCKLNSTDLTRRCSGRQVDQFAGGSSRKPPARSMSPARSAGCSRDL